MQASLKLQHHGALQIVWLLLLVDYYISLLARQSNLGKKIVLS